MNLYFANAWGWLGLVALGPLVYLHFFRRQTRRRAAPALFLVRKTSVSRRAGNRFERWRRSASFWLQAAAIVLASVLLAQPRSLNTERVATVVFCLDGSFSMNAFREPMLQEIERAAETIHGRLPHVEWVIMDTLDGGRSLYRGGRLVDALEVCRIWRATRAHHDALPALFEASRLIERGGVALWVSDRELDGLPTTVKSLLVGSVVENVAVSGIETYTTEGVRMWKAVIRNHGLAPAATQWWVEADSSRSETRAISIGPQGMLTVQGRMPEGGDALAVVIGDDGFSMDNRAPAVWPSAKGLRIGLSDGEAEELGAVVRMVETVPNCVVVDEATGADISVRQTEDLGAGDSVRAEIVFRPPGDPAAPLRQPGYTMSNHPLCAGLSFEGLLLREGDSFLADQAGDEALVWNGDDVVVFLRGEQLVFNFAPSQSNADRLPGFVLLLYRFVEYQRERKVAPEARNVDIAQRLSLAWPRPLEAATLVVGETRSAVEPGGLVLAPLSPSFFSVEANGQALLRGAAQFADARESDFRRASRSVDLGAIDTEIARTFYDKDFFTTILALCLACAVLGQWYASYRENL